jgi:hypothetical protein
MIVCIEFPRLSFSLHLQPRACSLKAGLMHVLHHFFRDFWRMMEELKS